MDDDVYYSIDFAKTENSLNAFVFFWENRSLAGRRWLSLVFALEV